MRSAFFIGSGILLAAGAWSFSTGLGLIAVIAGGVFLVAISMLGGSDDGNT